MKLVLNTTVLLDDHTGAGGVGKLGGGQGRGNAVTQAATAARRAHRQGDTGRARGTDDGTRYGHLPADRRSARYQKGRRTPTVDGVGNILSALAIQGGVDITDDTVIGGGIGVGYGTHRQLEIGRYRLRLGCFDISKILGYGYSGQYPDDGDSNHQLDQSEPLLTIPLRTPNRDAVR